MRRWALLAVGLVALLAAAPRAETEVGSVSGTIAVTRDGAPADASGVVLYVVGYSEKAPRKPAEIHQKDKHFAPDLVAITAGQSVAFPNDDAFFHNVFSPSPTRTFDLGSFPRGERKSKRFPDVGVVDVFCNIHPDMAATILVLPNRSFTAAAPDGTFRIDGVPPGSWTLYAFSRRTDEPVSAPIEVSAGGETTVSLALEETDVDFSHLNKFGEKYRDPDETYH